MPRRSSHRTAVPRINPDVVRFAFDHLATGNPYFIREIGRDAIKGCMLRVQRQTVELGTRLDGGNRWHRVTRVDPGMSIDEIESARLAVRSVIRSVEDEDEEPDLRLGRQMTVQELWQRFRDEYVRKKSTKRSGRTLEFYDHIWGHHLLPRIGASHLKEVTISGVEELTEEIARQVRTSRPWAEGRHTAKWSRQNNMTTFGVAWAEWRSSNRRESWRASG